MQNTSADDKQEHTCDTWYWLLYHHFTIKIRYVGKQLLATRWEYRKVGSTTNSFCWSCNHVPPICLHSFSVKFLLDFYLQDSVSLANRCIKASETLTVFLASSEIAWESFHSFTSMAMQTYCSQITFRCCNIKTLRIKNVQICR